VPVGNPAGEEQCGRGLREVDRADSRLAEIVSRVVQRHDHHDKSAQQVNGFYARANGSFAVS
jgi:hypothetical protein